MKFAKKYPLLSFFFFATIIAVILINYVFSETPQFWKYGYKTGQIVTNLSLGYLVSLLFFYIVVFLKEEKDERNISRRIEKSLSNILKTADNLERKLFKGNSKSTRDPEKIKEICDKTSMYEINYSSNIKQYHWVDYLNHIADECSYQMEKIFKINGVDTNLIRILTDLEDSSLFSRAKLVVGHPEDKRPITPLYNEIIQFFKIIQELENYYERKFLNEKIAN